jgi:hypothetical protein
VTGFPRISDVVKRNPPGYSFIFSTLFKSLFVDGLLSAIITASVSPTGNVNKILIDYWLDVAILSALGKNYEILAGTF